MLRRRYIPADLLRGGSGDLIARGVATAGTGPD